MDNNWDLIERNETAKNANGGTELFMRFLYGGGVPRDLLLQAQIIPSRIRDLKNHKIRILTLHDLPEDPEMKKMTEENFRKMVVSDVKDKPNLSKILLDSTLSEDVKLKILRKYIKYSTEDEVFSESADRIRLEINNLLKVKKVRSSNDYDEIWAAAGHPHAVFPTNFNELVKVTGALALAVE